MFFVWLLWIVVVVLFCGGHTVTVTPKNASIRRKKISVKVKIIKIRMEN